MTIKLVDLLIETVFEDANYEAVYDELIPNPATGKNIKVRSALSNSQHPAYQAALAHIEGRAGDPNKEDSGTTDVRKQTAASDKRAAEAEAEAEAEDTARIEKRMQDLASQGLEGDAATTIIEKEESIGSANTELENISKLVGDPDKFNKLSETGRGAVVAKYRDLERDKKATYAEISDSYVEAGIEPPPELQEEMQQNDSNIKAIEQSEKQETEDSAAAGEDPPKSWSEKYGEFVNDLDFKTEDGIQGFLDDAPETARGI